MLRGLTRDIDAWTANGVRYPIAAILYWPVLWHMYRKGVLTKQVIKQCFVPAFFSFTGQIFWAMSFYHLEASVVGFLIRSSIIWTLLGGMLVFADERRLLREPRFYLGLLITLGGFVTLSLVRNRLVGITPTGVALILVCGFLFGSYAVSIRYFVRDIPSILSVGVVANFVSIGTLCMLPLGDFQALTSVSSTTWLLIVLSSILGIALGHAFLYTAVNRIGPSISSSVTTIAPFITAAVAYVFLKEELTPAQWGAGIAIVAGVVLLLSIKRSDSATKEPTDEDALVRYSSDFDNDNPYTSPRDLGNE